MALVDDSTTRQTRAIYFSSKTTKKDTYVCGIPDVFLSSRRLRRPQVLQEQRVLVQAVLILLRLQALSKSVFFFHTAQPSPGILSVPVRAGSSVYKSTQPTA